MDAKYSLLLIWPLEKCVRETQREKAMCSLVQRAHLNISKETIITALLLEACETSERQRIVQGKIRLV
jgi:hypothetical protein